MKMFGYLRLVAATFAFCACIASCVAYGADPIRTYDGTGNNADHLMWGAAGTELVRLAPAAYDDTYSTPRGGLIGPTPPNPALPIRTPSVTPSWLKP